jgi:hypothetical protein
MIPPARTALVIGLTDVGWVACAAGLAVSLSHRSTRFTVLQFELPQLTKPAIRSQSKELPADTVQRVQLLK